MSSRRENRLRKLHEKLGGEPCPECAYRSDEETRFTGDFRVCEPDEHPGPRFCGTCRRQLSVYINLSEL